MFSFSFVNQPVSVFAWCFAPARFVLFGFSPLVALHFERSPLNHSDRYASSGDRPNCLATNALIPESFMKHPG